MWRRLLERRRAGRAAPVRLTLYRRADCPLCDELKAELRRARVPRPFALDEVDISGDPELEARLGRSIPVLEAGGRVLAKGRTTAADFTRRYRRLLDARDQRGERCR